jgi:hypothetical protein
MKTDFLDKSVRKSNENHARKTVRAAIGFLEIGIRMDKPKGSTSFHTEQVKYLW